MIMHIYAYYDPKLEAYSQPFYKVEDADISVAQLTRLLKTAKAEELEKIAGYDFYWLGTFDDEKGIIVPGKTLLLSSIGGIR